MHQSLNLKLLAGATDFLVFMQVWCKFKHIKELRMKSKIEYEGESENMNLIVIGAAVLYVKMLFRA